jgi:predicted enzyme related to lactoylglutathione lyase
MRTACGVKKPDRRCSRRASPRPTSRAQQTMINFRVRDLDAMLMQLRAKGADVAEETQEMEGVGRFGWVADPEGNRIELWQPA